MVDDFAGYKALFATGIIELGCLAHARRKFFDLNAAQPNPIAQEALDRIAALYAIEAEGRDEDFPTRRYSCFAARRVAGTDLPERLATYIQTAAGFPDKCDSPYFGSAAHN